MPNITNNMLLQVCQLSSVKDIDMYIGGKVIDIPEILPNEISQFEIINADNPQNFGAVALKLGNDIIISFSSSGNFLDILDWVGNIRSLYRPHPYSHHAIDFAREVLKQNTNISKIYLTGHSLGGYLAQFSAYYLYKDYKNLELTTFNSLGFSAPNLIKNKYQLPVVKQKFKSYMAILLLRRFILNRSKPSIFYRRFINTYKYIEQDILKEGGIIDKDNIKWKGFCSELENLTVNYYIDADPIYSILATKNIGIDIVLDSDYTKGLPKDGLKAHNLDNFNDRI